MPPPPRFPNFCCIHLAAESPEWLTCAHIARTFFVLFKWDPAHHARAAIQPLLPFYFPFFSPPFASGHWLFSPKPKVERWTSTCNFKHPIGEENLLVCVCIRRGCIWPSEQLCVCTFLLSWMNKIITGLSQSGRKVLRGAVVKVQSPFPTILPRLALWKREENGYGTRERFFSLPPISWRYKFLLSTSFLAKERWLGLYDLTVTEGEGFGTIL